MIILDTNVISELLRQRPDEAVIQWMNRQPRASVWTTSIAVFESRTGLLTMPAGKRRTALIAAFESMLNEKIQGRVAGFDLTAAERAAELEAAAKEMGRTMESRDTMIAGIVLANHAVLATRNLRHFEGLGKSVVNPWE